MTPQVSARASTVADYAAPMLIWGLDIDSHYHRVVQRNMDDLRKYLASL